MHNRVGLGEQTKLMMSMSILLCSNLNYNCTIVLFEIFSMFFPFLLWISRENGAETNNKDPMEPFNSKYFPSSPLGDPLHANCLKVFKHIQHTYWRIEKYCFWQMLGHARSLPPLLEPQYPIKHNMQDISDKREQGCGDGVWTYVSNKYQLFQR